MRISICLALVITVIPSALVADVPSFDRWRASTPSGDYPSRDDYLRVLSRWPRYAESDWHEVRGDPTMAYYGPGDSGWGMMCHASAMFCYALLATDPGYQRWENGPARENLIWRVNQGIEFMTRCHASGDIDCTDGQRWSSARTKWHSATWAENMGAAADLAWAHLTPGNRERVRRVLTWEAGRLGEEVIPSGDFADTKAESNAWNASVVARAAVMFPDDERAPEWRENAIAWAMNTLSVPQDAQDHTRIDGRRVSDWVSTVNVHETYASENHGYYHVCYMWWPMWCLASAHYSYASHGEDTPGGMYHHWRDLFGVLKRDYLADGRFGYVGGKDWPRYIYGLTAAVPAYVVLADELGEPAARNMEREAFRRYEWEQLHNGDGSFVGKRLAGLKAAGTSGYQAYCRYEADEAVMLGLAYALHKLKPASEPLGPAAFRDALRGGFECPEAEIVFRHGDDRFVGWATKTRTGRPQAVIGVPGDSTLPEWQQNLCGSFAIEGMKASPTITSRAQGLIDGGLFGMATLEWGLSAPPPRTATRWLEVVDDNVATKTIAQPKHPIFTTPHRIDSLAGLVDADSISAASPDWTVLATNDRGGPSIVESVVGKGRIVVCMNTCDSDFVAGRATGHLFENLITYANGPLGHLPQQTVTRGALDALGVDYSPIGKLDSTDLSQYGSILVDRGSSPDMRSNGWRLVDYAEQGGTVIRFCIQDTEWSEDQLSGERRVGAITHRVGVVALPDGRTTLLRESARANTDVTVAATNGLQWNIGNDIFNGNARTLRSDGGPMVIPGVGGEAQALPITGNWLNVDGQIGLAVDGEPIRLIDRPNRTAPYQSYCYETVALGSVGRRDVAAGESVLDHVTAFVTRASTSATRRLAMQVERVPMPGTDIAVAEVTSPLKRRYIVGWNFGEGGREVAPLGRIEPRSAVVLRSD